jgi:hypothetical protein
MAIAVHLLENKFKDHFLFMELEYHPDAEHKMKIVKLEVSSIEANWISELQESVCQIISESTSEVCRYAIITEFSNTPVDMQCLRILNPATVWLDSIPIIKLKFPNLL